MEPGWSTQEAGHDVYISLCKAQCSQLIYTRLSKFTSSSASSTCTAHLFHPEMFVFVTLYLCCLCSEDSPQWLKELKTKKRLSQYENES